MHPDYSDYTLSSSPFSSLTKLYIDETFIEDTSLLDFTMLENVETIYISSGLDVTENFELVDDGIMYKIYQIKAN